MWYLIKFKLLYPITAIFYNFRPVAVRNAIEDSVRGSGPWVILDMVLVTASFIGGGAVALFLPWWGWALVGVYVTGLVLRLLLDVDLKKYIFFALDTVSMGCAGAVLGILFARLLLLLGIG